ncbi:MAG: minor capsid protein [Deltaproteobacteria bacterium]|nr:minor capsid protein [Deltaproteobacteria bacterium]
MLPAYLEQSDGSAIAAVSRWAEDTIATDDAFVRWHYETGLMGHMAGELMVRAVELEDENDDDEDGATDLTSEPASKAHVRNSGSAFFGLSFEAAVEFFRGKSVMSPEAFDALDDKWRASGFTARALASEALRERALGAITRMLDEGGTLEDIVSSIRADEVALGISPASHDALDTIVRTNVATAYGAGKFAAYSDPAVAALRPYLMFVTAGDGRVRESHQLLEGKVFEATSELAALYAPPIGFRCRCSVVSVSQRQFEARGYSLTRDRIDGAEPDAGFGGAPGPLL